MRFVRYQSSLLCSMGVSVNLCLLASIIGCSASAESPPGLRGGRTGITSGANGDGSGNGGASGNAGASAVNGSGGVASVASGGSIPLVLGGPGAASGGRTTATAGSAGSSGANPGSVTSGGGGSTGVAASGGKSPGSTGGVASGSASGGALATGGAQSESGAGGKVNAAGGSKPTAASDPEVCDGLDNDGNGMVDDVDTGKDGVCDCLRIATLGAPGTWGEGDVFAEWLSERASDGARSLKAQTLTKELLSTFQVVVVENLSSVGRTYSSAEVAALQSWVEGGGGLMTLIGYGDPGEAANVNSLLAPFSIKYGDQQILNKNGAATTVAITDFTTHPVSGGITALGVDNGYPVLGSGQVIARNSGYDVAQVQQPGKGHVLAWGDEWITYNSEWVEHADYQVQLFWVNALKWLTPINECQVPVPPELR